FLSSTGYERMSQTRKHYILKGNGTNFTETRIILDKNSEGFSSFPDMFTPIPNNFNLNLTTGLDKDTSYSGNGSEQLKLDVDIDLPLEMRINDLILTDTFPFTIDTADSPIEALTLKIFFNNEFPFGGETDIFFTDTNGLGEADNIIVSLFGTDGWSFDAGVTNSSGETISPTESSITVSLTKKQLDSLKNFNASKLVFSSTLNTYNSSSGQNIKIYTFYKIGIRVGAKIDYSINVLDMMNN
ncbi:MAG: hypothetical protein U9Q83_03320, partial [Bacteroidota bacterium]|nr:hypothetical protein [Bacteroidota bacterium]